MAKVMVKVHGKTETLNTVSILKRLPKKVKIKGIGINRDIFIDAKKVLPLVKGKGFNWGYDGPDPRHLAAAVLLRYLTPKQTNQCSGILTVNLISKMELNNFEGYIKLNDLFADIFKKGEPSTKKIYYKFKETKLADDGGVMEIEPKTIGSLKNTILKNIRS